jgi:hypothetical protein
MVAVPYRFNRRFVFSVADRTQIDHQLVTNLRDA